MEKANKRILKNTIMLYIRMGVLILVQLYVSRVILKTLGVEDFGIYNLVGSVVILMQFLNSSLTLSVNRFIAYSLSLDNKEKTRKVFSMSLNIHMLLALVILVLAETIGLWFVNTQLVIPETRMFAANVVYQFSVLSFLGMIIRVPYNAVVIAHEDMNVYAYLSIFEGIGKLGAALLLPYFFYDDLIVYSILFHFKNSKSQV
jgi:O-antigen/teichoic acid export membrane protein